MLNELWFSTLLVHAAFIEPVHLLYLVLPQVNEDILRDLLIGFEVIHILYDILVDQCSRDGIVVINCKIYIGS